MPLAFAAAATRFGFGYEDSGFVNFVAASLVTFGVSALSWHLFERLINGLERHFRYERASDVLPEEPVLTPLAPAITW